MTKLLLFTIVTILIVGLATGPSLQTAMAKNNFVICADDIISNQVINARVVVPSGTNCSIEQSTINGDVEAENAGLGIGESTIEGNVLLREGNFVLVDSTINGNLKLRQVGVAAAAGINTVTGDIVVKKGAFALTGTLNGKLSADKASVAMAGLTIVGKLTLNDTRASLNNVIVDGSAHCKKLEPESNFVDVTYLGNVKGCPI